MANHPVIYTVGHSNRRIEDLLAILKARNIGTLVDIRTIPKSRFNPQFNTGEIGKSLKAEGIDYLHMPSLGGLRKSIGAASPNMAWENASFRGFADYMQTSEFEPGLASLIAITSKSTIAIMCAEAVPWRCHRSLVSDALTARGVEVQHLMSPTKAQPHRMTPFAKVDGSRVTYPPMV